MLPENGECALRKLHGFKAGEQGFEKLLKSIVYMLLTAGVARRQGVGEVFREWMEPFLACGESRQAKERECRH